jgi:carbonic anhydrase
MKSRASKYLVIAIGLLFVLSVFGASGAQRRTRGKVKTDPAPQAKVDCAESNEGVDATVALARLIQGNIDWQQSRMADRNWPNERQRTRCAQHPFAVVVSCMDSRVPPELIFDQGVGDIFVIRVAGPVLDNDQLASLEYALINIGVRLVVVLGHTDCGAVKGAVARVPNNRPNTRPFLPFLPALPALLAKLEPAIMEVSARYTPGRRITSDEKAHIDRVAFHNARRMRDYIAFRPNLRVLPGLQVKWGLYYTGSGRVAIDPTELEQGYQPCPPQQCK